MGKKFLENKVPSSFIESCWHLPMSQEKLISRSLLDGFFQNLPGTPPETTGWACVLWPGSQPPRAGDGEDGADAGLAGRQEMSEDFLLETFAAE